MANPSVTRVDALVPPGVPSRGMPKRYRLVGGDLSNGWEARAGEDAWCEVSIWPAKPAEGIYGAVEEHIGSYGGEVWPSAWPQLFVVHDHGWPRGPRLLGLITDEARELFRAADEAYEARRATIGNHERGKECGYPACYCHTADGRRALKEGRHAP